MADLFMASLSSVSMLLIAGIALASHSQRSAREGTPNARIVAIRAMLGIRENSTRDPFGEGGKK